MALQSLSPNAIQAYKYFTDVLHFTPEAAAGAVANLMAESGVNLDPGIQSGIPGEDSYGIAQWNKRQGNNGQPTGRQLAMDAFLSTNNHDRDSLHGQLAFIGEEMSGPYSRVASDLRGMTDPRQAAAEFDRRYEGSDGRHRDKRMDYAAQVHDLVQNNPDLVQASYNPGGVPRNPHQDPYAIPAGGSYETTNPSGGSGGGAGGGAGGTLLDGDEAPSLLTPQGNNPDTNQLFSRAFVDPRRAASPAADMGGIETIMDQINPPDDGSIHVNPSGALSALAKGFGQIAQGQGVNLGEHVDQTREEFLADRERAASTRSRASIAAGLMRLEGGKEFARMIAQGGDPQMALALYREQRANDLAVSGMTQEAALAQANADIQLAITGTQQAGQDRRTAYTQQQTNMRTAAQIASDVREGRLDRIATEELEGIRQSGMNSRQQEEIIARKSLSDDELESKEALTYLQQEFNLDRDQAAHLLALEKLSREQGFEDEQAGKARTFDEYKELMRQKFEREGWNVEAAMADLERKHDVTLAGINNEARADIVDKQLEQARELAMTEEAGRNTRNTLDREADLRKFAKTHGLDEKKYVHDQYVQAAELDQRERQFNETNQRLENRLKLDQRTAQKDHQLRREQFNASVSQFAQTHGLNQEQFEQEVAQFKATNKLDGLRYQAQIEQFAATHELDTKEFEYRQGVGEREQETLTLKGKAAKEAVLNTLSSVNLPGMASMQQALEKLPDRAFSDPSIVSNLSTLIGQQMDPHEKTAMIKNLEFFKNMDPEDKVAYEDYLKATGNGLSDTAMRESDVEYRDETLKKAEAAADIRSRIRSVRMAIAANPGSFRSGPVQQWIGPLLDIANDLGIATDHISDIVGTRNKIESLLAGIFPQLRVEGSGAVSDWEGSVMQMSIAAMSQDEAAFMSRLSEMESYYDRMDVKASFIDDAISGGMRGNDARKSWNAKVERGDWDTKPMYVMGSMSGQEGMSNDNIIEGFRDNHIKVGEGEQVWLKTNEGEIIPVPLENEQDVRTYLAAMGIENRYNEIVQ